ncbi:MAG: YdeI/OmpD-associated family protein [Bryobacteraceae bacterium]
MSVHEMKAGLPVIAFASASDWEDWLSSRPKESKGVWLKLAKKQSGLQSVSRQEAIDGALCYGWIDGQLQKFDEHHWLVRFTPRSSKSKWSEVNRIRAQQLIDQGRMKAAGLQEVKRAKSDGRWKAAYAPQSKAVIPDDLQKALDNNREANRLFSKLDRLNRYAIVHRVQDAKKPETRASRIEKYVQMLARGETIYPLKAKN